MLAGRLLLVASLTCVACRSDDSGVEPPPAPGSSAEPEAGGSTPAPAPADDAALVDGLDAALARAIEPPQNDDGTYHVDPFVAVLLFEHLSRSGGAPWFEPFSGDGADGTPEAGYRVGALPEGSLPAQLGLREGDIVEALNGVVLTGPDRLGFALDGAENRVTVMIFREDVSFTNSYRLSGGQAWRDLLAGFTGAPAVAVADLDADAGAGEPAGGGEPAVEAPTRTPPSRSGAAGRGAGSRSAPNTGTTRPRSSAGGATKPRPASGGKPAHPSAGGTTRPSASPIACESSTRCTITKAHFDDLVAAPERLQSQAQVVPAIRNDVFSGYKLKSVKPGTDVARLGFRAGDKITHVNGYDLTDDVQAMQLYWQLGGTRIFKIRYERGGRPAVKTVVVK